VLAIFFMLSYTMNFQMTFLIPHFRYFMSYFNNECFGFHQVSKREKTFEATRPEVELFHYFRAFGNLMKPEARVFEITSPTKKISLNYHLNNFSQFKF